jgi:protein arginine kinase activator
MRCERCEEREATVQQITIVNDQVTHKRLCEECAEEEEADPADVPGTSVSHIMSNLFEDEESEQTDQCEQCGMTFQQFQKRERLGCAQCYESFEERLEPLIHRIHGSDQHVGEGTGATTKAEISDERKAQRLRKKLDRAVHDENYEKAAELRDRIEALTDDE